MVFSCRLLCLPCIVSDLFVAKKNMEIASSSIRSNESEILSRDEDIAVELVFNSESGNSQDTSSEAKC